jgi:cytidyltransferase-like protein
MTPRVYADIVGDLFHYGHISFFKKARELGDYLVVGVHSDKTCSGYKRQPIIEESQRYEMIRNCKLVDEVIEDAPYITTKEFIIKNKIDVVVRGNGSSFTECYKDPVEMGIMRYVEYTEGVSTTQIIEDIVSREY